MKLKPEVRECVGGYRLEFEGMPAEMGYNVGFVAYQRDAHPRFGGGISQAQALYNADRVVLAWNAFAGIPNHLIVAMPGPVAELARFHADGVERIEKLAGALMRLMACPALNLDDLEDEDRAALEMAQQALAVN